MIKYNTQDLIRRATQLADLENSDFISWNENIMAINEVYKELYQKAINRDCKFYMNECLLESPIVYDNNKTCYDLPDDFYQLYSLNEVNTNKCLVRESVNEPFNNNGYDIINNQLVIYGQHLKSISMKYYPVPQSLTYKGNDVPVQLSAELYSKANYIDVYDRNICYITSNVSEDVYTYNWETNEDIKLASIDENTENFRDENIIGCKNGVLVIYTGEDTKKYSIFYNYKEENQIGFMFEVFGLDTKKNMVGLEIGRDVHNNILNIDLIIPFSDISETRFKENVFNTISKIIEKFTPTENEQSLLNMDLLENNIIRFVETNIKIGDISKPETIAYTLTEYFCDLENDTVEIGEVYTFNYGETPRTDLLDTTNSAYDFYNSGTHYYKAWSYKQRGYNIVTKGDDRKTVYANAVGVMKIDGNTGYGIMVKDGKNAVIKSIYPNTEADYPNNLFIEMLAYKLAIMYKSKQGGDVSGLSVLYQNAENAFYDTLPRDVYGVTRVQNVY